LPLPADQFYLADPPTHLQQGDIIAGVPQILLPPLEASVVVRSTHHRLPIEHLEAGDVDLVRELALADAFDLGPEYIVVSAVKGPAMIITATCDLDDLDIWMVTPLRPVEGCGLDVGNLEAGKYVNLYHLPENDYFAPPFLDLSDLRPARPQLAPLKNRIASVKRDAQFDIVERMYSSIGRAWGYRKGEKVEPPGKYETEKFRCARCNLYDVPVPEKALPVGAEFPECEQCAKIKKPAQWYRLTKHRKS
jgi:hypothetical protein